MPFLRSNRGLLTILMCAHACLYPQHVNAETKIQLKLTNSLNTFPATKFESVLVSMPSLNQEGVTRVLDQVPNCISANTNGIVGLLRMATVVNQIICNRIGVREGFGLTEQVRAALELAQNQWQPSLNLSAGLDAERGGKTNGTIALRLEWLLFDFGATSAGIQQSRLALSAVLDNQRAEVLLALAEAAQLFAAAKTASSRLEAADINLQTAQESARLTEGRQAAGAGSLAEKIQAQTALAQSRLEQVRAKSQQQTANGALSIAMGLSASYIPEFESAEMVEDSVFNQPLDIQTLIEEARSRHPRVTAARARLAETQERIKAVDAERWGNISMSAVAGKIRTNGFAELRNTSTASVLWTLPLLDRGVTTARQRDVLGQIQVRNAGIDDALSQIELQVWQQSQLLISDREVLREARIVRNSAELSLRVSSERYRSGVGLFSDVLNAQNIAANARFQWAESRSNLLRSQLRLAAAVGRFGPLAPA
jgi:outer membrane protein